MNELSHLGKLALSYAADGFLVFPCAAGTKFPLGRDQLGIPEGQPAGLTLATTDDDHIHAWWSSFPRANVGIRTGEVSGITVVDLDGAEGRDNFFDAIPEGETWPETLTAATPSGGCHLYFQYDERLGQTSALLPSVDVRNDGGYVVAPGSVLADGAGEYTIEDNSPIAPLPAWILALQDNRRNLRKTSGESSLQSPHGIGEGSRNDQLTRIAGALRRQGIAQDAIESTLAHVNEELCEPPLEDEEVSRIAQSVARYDADEIETVENTRPIPAVEYVKPMCEFLRDPRKVRGTSTGIEEMDRLMGGGYREGEVIALNAPAKTGKSTLVRKLIHSLVKRNIKVGYASREEYADREVLPQLLSIELGKSVLKADVDEGKYESILKEWPLYFAPGYGKFPLFGRWLENCKEAGCDVVFVDHLHFMTKDEDYQEAVRVMHEAVKMAKTLGLCIFMIIQPKGLQPGQELGLETLRGGAPIGQAITMLFTLTREKEHQNVVRIRLAAKRSPLAKLGEFHLQFDEESLDMEEVEFHPAEQPQAPETEAPPQGKPLANGVDLFKRSQDYWANRRAGDLPPPLSE